MNEAFLPPQTQPQLEVQGKSGPYYILQRAEQMWVDKATRRNQQQEGSLLQGKDNFLTGKPDTQRQP